MPELPADVVATLAGSPPLGELDQGFLLLTADAEGIPDVCMLSRAEVEADASEVRVVVASRKATANLARGGRATLVVVARGVPHYVALSLLRAAGADGATGFALSVTRVLRDDLGVELYPMLYRVEEWLMGAERWDRSRALMSALREEPSGSEEVTDGGRV